MAEALAEYWHRRVREELGFASEDGPTSTAVPPEIPGWSLQLGLPACPNLEDNAKVVELLSGDKIGVTVSDGFQLHPEQTTDAIICHHPQPSTSSPDRPNGWPISQLGQPVWTFGCLVRDGRTVPRSAWFLRGSLTMERLPKYLAEPWETSLNVVPRCP